ncbi:sugar ABC transporter substrate-binding protein [Leisingera daeponensis]|uniref:sugar ABC transporter substrate-binding protein n=1 Tax=Leisingera daeponensis TaxID=405746 RepID=UPI001C93F386|nr:sugar ABC transporter substrate-binding protein [Leisingera daeponensis]MBY6059283.1 sugar ABC transporter substrate-binding protein [Leisingera daeponensis]
MNKTLMLAATCLVGLPLAAQAQDACETHEIDVGNGHTVTTDCDGLQIAAVVFGSNNMYLQANIKAAKETAEALGAEMTVFDGQWDPATTFNHVQNIVSSGEYDAIINGPYNGSQFCDYITNTAPEADVLFVTVNSPGCDRDTNEGTDLWSPGTLSFVGGVQGREAYRNWLMKVAEENPGSQKVITITGPDTLANTINFNLGLEGVKAAYPKFDVVGMVTTDYSVLQANEKIAPLLQANDDITLMISNYSDMTRGVVQAIQQAGRVGDFKIYDFGGSEWAFEAVDRGLIESTLTMTPYTEYEIAVKAIVDAWNGKDVPNYLPLESTMVTKDNIADNAAQY